MALPLSVIESPQVSPDARCCECVSQCEYRPERIRLVLNLRVRFGYPALKELASSIFDPYQGYDSDHAPQFGPSCEASWALLVSEVEQCERRGIHNPHEIAAALCPFSGLEPK